ncbi:MAG TPA: TetR/AcrR family transcriptional regulator [Acidimicrobiales bacterium]
MDAEIVRRAPFGSNPLVGERGTDTQRRILAAALDVFGEVGFAEARVELISEKAGCSRPAFYQYFSSKDDVFWALAGRLGREMVALAERLERVTPDAAGLAHLTDWIGDFMGLHEAWAPVFASFQVASRDHRTEARSSTTISDRTGVALLGAFGAQDDEANRHLMAGLVAVLIRCSFYAEQAPRGMSRRPLVKGVAQLFHRIFAGPIEGVNVVRSGAARRRRVAVDVPEPTLEDRVLRPRGERTRQRLLDAGASVLPARGYHDTRVDDIVAVAGVSHGTFYRYFENTDDFFRVLAGAASARMVGLLDQLDLGASEDGLRAWLKDWLTAYETDGGVISTWQEMWTSPELAAFSRQVAASVFTRLVRLLERRDFGDPVVDATTFLSLVERVPYSVHTLQYMSPEDAIESMVTVIRRGFLGLDDGLLRPVTA